MGIRIKRFRATRLGLWLLGIYLACVLLGGGVVFYYWHAYGRMIDEHLAGHIAQNTARIYASPTHISVGQALSEADLVV